MRIYLVRHADAVAQTPGNPDASRHLSSGGRLSFRETARRLRDAGVRVSRILSSPLVRAVQTADILAEALEYEGEVQPHPRLGPGFDLEGLNELLDSFPEETEIGLVGHEPDIGRIVSRLLALPKGYAMPKGAVAAIALPDAGTRIRGGLEWIQAGDRRIVDPAELL